jgi:hypothetical protein
MRDDILCETRIAANRDIATRRNFSAPRHMQFSSRVTIVRFFLDTKRTISSTAVKLPFAHALSETPPTYAEELGRQSSRSSHRAKLSTTRGVASRTFARIEIAVSSLPPKVLRRPVDRLARTFVSPARPGICARVLSGASRSGANGKSLLRKQNFCRSYKHRT